MALRLMHSSNSVIVVSAVRIWAFTRTADLERALASAPGLVTVAGKFLHNSVTFVANV